jgi:hypothetical protein
MSVIEAIEVLLKAFAKGLGEDARLEFIDRLVWTLEGNGDELFIARKRWAVGEDPELASLAMGQWCTPIGDSRGEAELIVAQAVKSWPQLQGKGEERLHEWTLVDRT